MTAKEAFEECAKIAKSIRCNGKCEAGEFIAQVIETRMKQVCDV